MKCVWDLFIFVQEVCGTLNSISSIAAKGYGWNVNVKIRRALLDGNITE
jgi:hypothetical protein